METSDPVKSDSMKYVVVARGLTKRYGDTYVTKDLDMHVPRGSIYAFLGVNGAGKTTSLRMLLGLTRPTRGRVTLLGRDALRDPQSRRDVGGMIEAPAVYRHLTGRENLYVFAEGFDVDQARLDEVLEIVGLSEVGTRIVGRYSLGMVQRLGIAIALLGDPELLILDEPQNGLDPAGMRDMRVLLQDLQARGHTLLIASHLLTEIERVATHVGLIANGRMVFEGTLAAFQAMTYPGLRVEVDDPVRALALLEPVTDTTKWTREGRVLIAPPAGNLRDEPTPQASAIARTLITGGVELHRLESVAPSLEETFFEFVGLEGTSARAARPLQGVAK